MSQHVPIAQNVREEKRTAVHKVCSFQERGDLWCEIVHVCAVMLLVHLFVGRILAVLLTPQIARNIVSRHRTVHTAVLQRCIGLRRPWSSYRILLDLAQTDLVRYRRYS